jgi:hypothetical protein
LRASAGGGFAGAGRCAGGGGAVNCATGGGARDGASLTDFLLFLGLILSLSG